MIPDADQRARGERRSQCVGSAVVFSSHDVRERRGFHDDVAAQRRLPRGSRVGADDGRRREPRRCAPTRLEPANTRNGIGSENRSCPRVVDPKGRLKTNCPWPRRS